MIEFNTKDMKTRKKVRIDGVDFTVRQMSNRELLDLMQLQRLNKDLSKNSDNTEQIEEILTNMTKMYINQFDDGGDQSKSADLINRLTAEEITNILTQIFEVK